MLYYEKVERNKDYEWVLFIHGLGGSTETWKYQMDDFVDFNVLNVDLHGHGQSEFSKLTAKLPQILAAKDINKILEKEGIDKVNIVALSLGTIIALEFEILYPEKVTSMILAGFVLNLKFTSKVLVVIAEGLKYIMPKRWLYPIFAKIIMPLKSQKKSRKIFVRESMKMKSKAFRAWINSLMTSRKKLNSYIKTINLKKIPVLFISGEEDYLFLPGVKKFTKKINDMRLHLVEKCGHVVSIEKSEIFNKISLDFIKNIVPELKKNETD